ncbi:hypothetical protein GCM10027020_15730 [Nocardioides salsibiostraticola]
MNTTTWLMRAADVSDTLSDSVESMGGSLVRALPRLAVAVVIIIVGLALGRALRWGSRRWLCRNHTTSFATVMSKLVGSLVGTLAVLSAITVVFPSVKPVDLLAGLGFFSLAVGFAFQDILENTLSGVLMLFRQPFTAGDQIEVQGQTGTVQAITIRETRIKTYDGQLILIPNRDVYKSVIRVQTHYEQRRISFIVGVAYENDAAEACRVVREALVAVSGVATEPAPEALVDQLNVSTVDLEARFWADPRQHESRLLTHEAITAVKAALDEAGIEMPADIVALQATPSFRAALQNDGEITPGGSLK